MPTLHMVLSASTETLQALQPQLRQGDAILLVGDACYLTGQITDANVYALGADLDARGLSSRHAEAVTDETWPDLLLSFAQQVTWP